jgi:hypothetical protein
MIAAESVRPAVQDTNVRSIEQMREVRTLLEAGQSAVAVAAATGVPLRTVMRWRRGRTASFGPRPVAPPWRPEDAGTYANLLGMYLGDGTVSAVRPGRALLRIVLDSAYPGIVEECAAAMRTVSDRAVQIYPREGWNVQCGWKGWPEAFPQHGPGRKHERPIVLEDWQQAIVDEHAGMFVRGLIHSDGCRTVNRFTTRLPSGRVAEYAYPRYFVSNLSADIRGLFCAACDRLGVRWTQSNARNISVSHRPSVAVLEALVGPKA